MTTTPTRVVTFEELIGRSIAAAEEAEALVQRVADDLATPPGAVALAAVHATLSEAYARLASAVVVNRSSLHATLERDQESAKGPRPS